MSVAAPPRRPATARREADSAELAEEPRRRTIIAVLGGFVLVWTVYFTLTEAPVAIKHDMLEAYAWGQEFQLGYHQHPPFWAWVCGLWFSAFPRSGWAFSLLSSVNAAIGLWGAWRLIGDFARGCKRLAAWLLLLLTPLYTFYAYKYNANIIFLSIWPWTLHFYLRSVQSRSIRDGIWFGMCVGFALMSKYYALILPATCCLALLQQESRWRYIASPAPYVAVLVAALICAPHVWWLFASHAPPVHYLESVSGRGLRYVTGVVGNTLLGVVGMNLGVFCVIGLTLCLSRQRPAAISEAARKPEFRVLATLALAPLLLTVVSAFALRTTVKPEMVLGIFSLLPLLVIEAVRLRDIDRLYRVSAALAAALTLGAFVVSPAIMLARTFLSPVSMKVPPFQEVATTATRLWHERTGLRLAYVGGTAWYENATAFYSPDRPHAFAYFDYAMNLWVTPEAIARHGLLSICAADDQRCLASTAGFVTPATSRTDVTLSHVFLGHRARPVRYVITIIPPRATY